MTLNNFFFIHSAFLFFLKIEEGSQSATGDPAGLSKSEIERVASVEQSTVSGTTVSADSARNSISKEG